MAIDTTYEAYQRLWHEHEALKKERDRLKAILTEIAQKGGQEFVEDGEIVLYDGFTCAAIAAMEADKL